RSVIAMAKTPSLKASTLPVARSMRLLRPRGSADHEGDHHDPEEAHEPADHDADPGVNGAPNDGVLAALGEPDDPENEGRNPEERAEAGNDGEDPEVVGDERRGILVGDDPPGRVAGGGRRCSWSVHAFPPMPGASGSAAPIFSRSRASARSPLPLHNGPMLLDSESVGDTGRHRKTADLEEALAAPAPAPSDGARVVTLVAGREVGRREAPARIALTAEDGLVGDAWARGRDRKIDAQVTAMQAGIAALLANGQPLELFGDNLFLDLDVSATNLPP